MITLAPWFWRSQPLNRMTGSEIFEILFKNDSICTLLESPYPSDNNQLCRFSICAGMPRQIKGKYQLYSPSLGQILPFLSQLLDINLQDHFFPSHLPFTGGYLGWLSYDLAAEIEFLPNLKLDSLPFPVAYWYVPESMAIADHHEQVLWLASSNINHLDSLQFLLENNSLISNSTNINTQDFFVNKLDFLTDKFEYQKQVNQALKYIQAGDIFQTNLSLRFHTTTNVDSWKIYRNLQTINPSPFASYWRSPWGVVVSASPERLVKLEGQKAQSRPIAGTRPRGLNLKEDQKFEQELLNNQKEKAEHIMLIDLERNDLGKVCQWGSVQVDELLIIEKYSHVMHLVSNVQGNLGKNYSSIDLIKALFPGGTITGCPKVRCMEIIEELEPFKRNLFYGSCGYIDQRGNLDLNILIRTLLITTDQFSSDQVNHIWGQVGAGIVADSNPEKEWYESLQKAQAQIKALIIDN